MTPHHIRFGAAYYHEYHRGDRLEQDLDAMVSAGFTVIRVGESVWSTWEPENGIFDLDWLQPVLDAAHLRGIEVILGTPTYAVPPWLVRLYPEIAGERGTGNRIAWGARQEVDFTHPAFRFHAERVIRAVLSRYASHPAVSGIQVDNEPGLELLHNHGVFQRFVDHLRQEYGDVEALNREWGLVYWSHRLSTWADLWTPDGNVQPQYDVAWRAFQAQQTTDFIGWQADLAREYTGAAQFVTTCIAYDRPAMDEVGLTARLDVTTGNAYYEMQDGLLLPDKGELSQSWTTRGTWALFQSADRAYATRQERFLVTETNASSIGTSWSNRPAYDGQWRQAAFALVARGASMIEYWHWHTLHFGAETYWGGVLPHSGQPGRTYAEVAKLGNELRQCGDLLVSTEPEFDAALLHSLPSKWLMQKYPPLADGRGGPDARSYQGIVDPFYKGFFDSKLQLRLVHAPQLPAPDIAAQTYRALIAPALYLADDAMLDWLANYAREGGHLVLGPRSAYADHLGRAREELAPAGLAQLMGAGYDEFSNVSSSVPVVGSPGSDLRLTGGSAATRWIDGLVATDASVLAKYEHPHFGRWAAVTSREVGRGRITYVGTVPNSELAQSLASWVCPTPVHGWRDLPTTVTVSSSRGTDGSRVHVVHNWSWDSATCYAPTVCRDALDGTEFDKSSEVQLTPWDVRILSEVG